MDKKNMLPRVVGCLSDSETFSNYLSCDAKLLSCDFVEVRLDELADTNLSLIDQYIIECKKFESNNYPVIATLRWESEGGKFVDDDGREEFLIKAIKELSMIDIEYRSNLREKLCDISSNNNKSIIVSFHDFEKTPDKQELQNIIDDIKKCEKAIPKIATMVSDKSDFQVLKSLLEENNSGDVCIIGMGQNHGLETRTMFPLLGSYLTYGFIDKPNAPGQPKSSDIRHALRRNLSEYNAYVIEKEQIIEFG